MAVGLSTLEKMVMSEWDGWRGRRVFITGHTGFKGSWMTLWLTQLGATVCGYALEPPSQPVEWIVDQLTQMWPGEASWGVEEGVHVHEATYLKLDCSKAQSRLGWRPVLSLPNSLQLIVEWSQQWQAGADMQRITLDQIAKYRDLCIVR
jgi:nucleoside-diphosphate-sugar epimerase